MDLFSMEPMRYWSPSSTMSAETKRQHLDQMIASHQYIWSEKFDGNWSRAVITAGRAALQTRGISKKTDTYGEIQDKVFFWNDVVKAFNKGDTVILGEIYIPGCIDRQIGSILRCLTPKAIERQKEKKLEWRIFDVLMLDGVNFMNTPVDERVRLIDEVVNRINNSLVVGVKYHEMDENFFDDLNNIFAKGGEGAVCYKKSALYMPGKRGPSAWDSCKVKQEISNDIDCLITGIEPAVRNYTGKDLENWIYWEDLRTGERLQGPYFSDYQLGKAIQPVSKGYYFNWPGAIYTSVYDQNHKLIPLCKVSGLTEEFKTELRDNFDDWYLCPVTIGGMMVSEANENISIRHPYLKTIRKEDISPDDCTLIKILS